jgi:hypothetical protein
MINFKLAKFERKPFLKEKLKDCVFSKTGLQRDLNFYVYSIVSV